MTSLFGTRKTHYVKTDDTSQSREQRMSRLKVELRDHIRLLGDYEILSADWLQMAASLHQIANVAFMETRLSPLEENPLNQKGKKDSGTLWDQERDELAIRIILEEGKLNLALRILHKFRQATRVTDKWDEMIKTAAKKFNSDVMAVSDRCRAFEQSLGSLLKFALNHVEALQILDLPEFLAHVKEELTEAAKSDKKELSPDREKLQDTLVLHYLSSLAAKAEDMDEDRIMELIIENSIIPLVVDHLNKHYNWYKIETLEAVATFLSNVMNSEAYGSEKSTFVPDKDAMAKLVNLKGFFVHELVTGYGLKKKEVQKLLDELEKFEKTVGPAKIVPLNRPKADEKKDDAKDAKDAKKDDVASKTPDGKEASKESAKSGLPANVSASAAPSKKENALPGAKS